MIEIKLVLAVALGLNQSICSVVDERLDSTKRSNYLYLTIENVHELLSDFVTIVIYYPSYRLFRIYRVTLRCVHTSRLMYGMTFILDID